jgi:chromosome segregation ATPase
MTTTTTTDTSSNHTRAQSVSSSTRTRSMLDGRRDDSMRRRRRVLAALDQAATAGDRLSAAAIARAAGVDRTFLYRHRDLMEKIHALQADPVTGDHIGPAVTRASLQADLLAAHERAARLDTRIRQLEQRLSQALGEHTWRESGLGAPTDIDALHQRISQLEQQVIDQQQQLDERDEDLAAARATNRDLMARLNTSTRPR